MIVGGGAAGRQGAEWEGSEGERRERAREAAADSAERREGPEAVARSRGPMETATEKEGAWGGPETERRR